MILMNCIKDMLNDDFMRLQLYDLLMINTECHAILVRWVEQVYGALKYRILITHVTH